MFERVKEGLQSAIRKLLDRDIVDEAAIKEFVRDVQRELLQADVNVRIVFELSKNVESKLMSERTKPGISVKERAVTLLYDEMVKIMGEETRLAPPQERPWTILLVGIQGSGKTTFAAKLAKYFVRKGYRTGLVCADVYRPGAYEQLRTMGQAASTEVFWEGGKDAVKAAREGKARWISQRKNLIIIDTAGRHKEEKSLLGEMAKMEEAVSPDLTLLVIDGTIGQQAYQQALAFSQSTKLGGIAVTKLDGTGKGGGALAAAAATGAKMLFVSNGERVDDIEEFSPSRFAGRMLGMGDLKGLVERVKLAEVDEDVAKRVASGKMNLYDFEVQLTQMTKLGPLQKVLEMLPGLPKVEDSQLEKAEKNVGKWRAIMKSMTGEEKKDPSLIGGGRIRRIAKGSGTAERDVKDMLTSFEQMKKMMKNMRKLRMNRELLKQFKGAGAA
ncbi:MAG: signal recognition particle protein [Nitrososphaerota archaeon]|nr:signal recognition particle protein [Nitrososphaerota archaeon]